MGAPKWLICQSFRARAVASAGPAAAPGRECRLSMGIASAVSAFLLAPARSMRASNKSAGPMCVERREAVSC